MDEFVDRPKAIFLTKHWHNGITMNLDQRIHNRGASNL